MLIIPFVQLLASPAGSVTIDSSGIVTVQASGDYLISYQVTGSIPVATFSLCFGVFLRFRTSPDVPETPITGSQLSIPTPNVTYSRMTSFVATLSAGQRFCIGINYRSVQISYRAGYDCQLAVV